MLGGGLAERCQENCPRSGKVLGRQAQLGKNRGIPSARLKDAKVAPLEGTEWSWLSGYVRV